MKPHRPYQSLRSKILWLAIGLFLATLLVAVVGLAGMRRISDSAKRIHQECLPILQCARLAQQALQDSARVRDQALLDVTDPDELDQLRVYEGQFQRADIEFDMYMKALIWGSESRIFKEVAGGLTHAEWRRHGLEGRLIVGWAPERIRQLASQADLYQAGYSNHARRALKQHRRALRLQLTGDGQAAELERQQAYHERTESGAYARLIRELFSQMDQHMDAYVDRTVADIAEAQRTTQTAALQLSLALLALIIVLCRILAVRTLVRPLQRLMEGVQALSRGDWTVQLPAASRDELGQLTEAFNAMAAQLVVLIQRERLLTSTVEAADAAHQRAERWERTSGALREANERLRQMNERLRGEITQRRQTEASLQQEQIALEGMDDVMRRQEERIRELQQEVNALLQESGRAVRYSRS